MTDEKKKIVRIVGVGGAAAVVPHLLGYQPAVDDVTMMVIAGPDVGAVTNMVGGLTGPHLPLMFAQASQVLGRGTQVAIFGWSDELSNRTLAPCHTQLQESDTTSTPPAPTSPTQARHERSRLGSLAVASGRDVSPQHVVLVTVAKHESPYLQRPADRPKAVEA